jgi:hypothetical protein
MGIEFGYSASAAGFEYLAGVWRQVFNLDGLLFSKARIFTGSRKHHISVITERSSTVDGGPLPSRIVMYELPQASACSV